MLNYEKLSKKLKMFRRFTGLTADEYNDLYAEIESKHSEYGNKRLGREERKKGSWS